MRDINDYEQQYINSSFETYQVKYRRKRVLRSLERMEKPGTVLEIGCGMEPLFRYFDNYKKWICVEPSRLFYDKARKYSSGNEKVKIYNGLFEDVVGKINEPVDFIICSSLLHEVEEPEKLLMAIQSLSNAGTIVHINVPNALSFHRILAKKMELIESEYTRSESNIRLQQNVVFDKDSLIKLIEECGNIDVIESGTYFLKPFTHEQMQRCIDNDILNEQILDGLDAIADKFPENGSEIFVDFKWYDKFGTISR